MSRKGYSRLEFYGSILNLFCLYKNTVLLMDFSVFEEPDESIELLHLKNHVNKKVLVGRGPFNMAT